MHKRFNLLADAAPTADPGSMETVDPDFECLKPLFD